MVSGKWSCGFWAALFGCDVVSVAIWWWHCSSAGRLGWWVGVREVLWIYAMDRGCVSIVMCGTLFAELY